MEQKDQKNDEKKQKGKAYLDHYGAFLLLVCTIALLCSFGMACFLFMHNNVQDVNIQFVMPVDSTGVLKEESLQKVAELKEEIIRHEQLLDDRYKHVLEQKENMNDLLTIGGMFLTIVLSLFGFFGYKSMATIEDKVKQEAKLTSEQTADNATKSKFANLETLMMETIKETVNKEKAESWKDLRLLMEDKLKESMKGINQKITEDIHYGLNEQKPDIEKITQDLSNLNDKVNKLQKGNNNSSRGRRTL